jgi:lipoprotein-anchoring transpeptidase ErfK/SrfK
MNKYLLLTSVVLGAFLHTIVPFIKSKYLSNTQGFVNPDNISENYNPQLKEGIFHGNTFKVPDHILYTTTIAKESTYTTDSNVLGKKSKEKVIKVSLKDQKLYMYEGDKKKKSFKISSGLWGTTPTGEFRIWTKLTSTLMTGGSKALGTYYYLPNVPYTMYFYNIAIPKSRGYGIHGAYWHNNFGQPMSHGCINMKPEEAKIVYEWANSQKGDDKGTKIIIY